MLFADVLADGIFAVFLFLVGVLLTLRIWFLKFDDKGEIKGAAQNAVKNGVANLLGKWLK
jgi:hypothetical protein